MRERGEGMGTWTGVVKKAKTTARTAGYLPQKGGRYIWEKTRIEKRRRSTA
jgi:hypothetical protein